MAVACVNRENMGSDFGLGGLQACFPKRRNRWLFQIEGVSATVGALPPLRGARPSLDFKEQQVAHLIQNIYYPLSVDWRPITLTLYDNKVNNLVFEWIRLIYSPNTQTEWRPVYQRCDYNTCFKRNALLCMYDGCGIVVEKWTLENVYPQTVNWGELDMGNSEIVTVDLSLRYDRAYPN